MREPLSAPLEAATPILYALPVEKSMARKTTKPAAYASHIRGASSTHESGAGVDVQAPLGTHGAPKRLEQKKWVTILVWMDRPYARLKDIPLRLVFRFLVHFARWCDR
jgi:hypothetical protein